MKRLEEFDTQGLDESALKQATLDYQAGRLDNVVRAASERVELTASDGLPQQEHGPWLELLGLALHDQGRPLEAADAIEKASLVAPIGDPTRIALASP